MNIFGGFAAAAGFSTSRSALTVDSCFALKQFSFCDCGSECGEWVFTRITMPSVLNFIQHTSIINDKMSVLREEKKLQIFSLSSLIMPNTNLGSASDGCETVKYCTVYYM